MVRIYRNYSPVILTITNFSEREIEQLKTVNDQIRKELADLQQSPDCQHIEIQTDEE
jgi:hypothetical protein